MGWFKSKSKPEDLIFSRAIRARDNWTCVKCGRVHEWWFNEKGEAVSSTLDNSHFFKRALWATRFDPENCDALCKIPCHESWEHEKKEGMGYWNFKEKQLGKRRFEALRLRAQLPGKKDRVAALLQAKAYLNFILPRPIGAKA